jgi:BlaI family penicillinase repressor
MPIAPAATDLSRRERQIMDVVYRLYLPTVPRESARRNALSHMVRTFFGGSTEAAVAALLDPGNHRMSESELDRISDLIDQARTQGR